MASTNSNPPTVPNSKPIPGVPHHSSPNSPGHSDYMNGKVFIGAGIILVIIIFFVVAFHVYARVFWGRRRSSMSWRRSLGFHDMPPAAGLDKATVDSLPKFTYTTPVILHEGANVVSKDAGAGVVECAVCLIGFEENDACRLLPKCSHIFHTECIDRWFLSNTTCPLCRTSAEQVDSDDSCPDEAPSVPCSAHQAFGDGIQRSNSSHSDCLLPHQESGSHVQRQDINNQTKMPMSGSPFGADQIEGAGLHVRRMLARTCSSRVNASYDLVGEDMHSDATSESVHAERNGSMGRGCANGNHAGDALVRNLHLPYWQRSISDRSLNARQNKQFPSNVLFWGNHSRVDSRVHREQHWGVGGQSLPHIAIDVPGPQDGTLTTVQPSATLQEDSHGFSLLQCSTRPVG